MDLIIRLRDLGLIAIHSIADLGYNFFFTSANDYLPFDLGLLGNMTLFEFAVLGGVSVWLVIKLVQWLL